MSFYNLPNPYDPRYAIPEYVMAEPPERGTFTTQWLPRGTIPALVPDYLAKPGRKLLGRNDAQLGSLGNHTLKSTSLSGTSLSGDTLGADATLVEQPGVPTKPPGSSLSRNEKIAIGAGIAVAAYLLLRKKRGR